MTNWILWGTSILVGVWLLYWFWYRNRAQTDKTARATAAIAATAQETPPAAPVTKDITFRVTTPDGVFPVVGDVACADGVYLPDVEESSYHTSYDGRWIRTGGNPSGTISARLVDRKTRQCWNLITSEAQALESIHWRLPRWNGEELNESGLADDAHTVFSDARFTAWMNANVQSAPVALSQVRDLWMPPDSVHLPKEGATLTLPPCPTGEVTLSAVRHWPKSLREETNPLQAISEPLWQILINDKAQPWLTDANMPVVWRPDGQALALYAWPESAGSRQGRLHLVIWSTQHGWQKWGTYRPADNKAWRVTPFLPSPEEKARDKAAAGDRTAAITPSLRWWNGKLLQRMQADVPLLDHLHDGARITHSENGPVPVAAAHNPIGRVRLQPVHRTRFMWMHDIAKPDQWQALSELVGSYPLIWTLNHKAGDGSGSTPGYRLHWGHASIPGLWELEHVIVNRRWAILLRHPHDDGQEANTQLYIWDGKDLKAMDLPWQVVRIYAMPSVTGGKSVRVRLVTLGGSVPTEEARPRLPGWQWPVSAPKPELLEQASNFPFYETRDIVPDAQGVWQLQPRWREVSMAQHPCSDGDYVWRSPEGGDELWWWGGLQRDRSNVWDARAPRTDGVCVTKGGTVLCGVGPAITPAPDGEGWAILEYPHDGPPGEDESAPVWKLHWLQPRKRQVRTIPLDATRPVLRNWDANGLHWYDEASSAPAPAQESEDTAPPPASAIPGAEPLPLVPPGDVLPQTGTPPGEVAAAAPAAKRKPHISTIVQTQWAKAAVQDLKQGPYGLWMRKQDMRYADAVRRRDDPPWDLKGKWRP